MPEEDAGIEMENEFEGELHDRDNHSDSSDDDELDEDELDQQMGEVDGEQGNTTEEQRLREEQSNQDQDLNDATDEGGTKTSEAESSARENGLVDSKDDAPPPDSNKEEEEPNSSEPNINEGIDDSEDQEEDNKPTSNDSEQTTNEVEEGDDSELPETKNDGDDGEDGDDGDLDLPDEMNLGGGEDNEQHDDADGSDNDDTMDIEENHPDNNEEDQGNDQAHDDGETDNELPDAPPDELRPDQQQTNEQQEGDPTLSDDPDRDEKNDEGPMQMDDDEESDKESVDKEEGRQEDSVGNTGEDAAENIQSEEDEDNTVEAESKDESKMEDHEQNEDHQNENKQNQTAMVGVESMADQNSTFADLDDTQNTIGQGCTGENENQQAPNIGGDRLDAGTSSTGEDSARREQHMSQSNPYRSLGDALKQWQDMLKVYDEMASDNQNEPPPDSRENTDSADAFVFVRDDDEIADTQTRDTATSEQSTQRPGMEPDAGDDSDAEEIHDETSEAKPDPLELESRTKDNVNETAPLDEQESIEKPHVSQEKKDKDDRKNSESLTPSKVSGTSSMDTEDQDSKSPTDTRMDIEEHSTDDPTTFEALAEEEAERLRLLQQQHLQSREAIDTSRAMEQWQRVQAKTARQSSELCEQLRLILEASLAARLEGDYRTGKRLNLRKIIPYIASQFRQDKIWLRRTKPSKREYQIMIAIDDSESMATYHSSELAIEALCVIGRALTLLEAGDLAVMSFGSSPKLVHSFGSPFSDEAGAAMLEGFTFEQQHSHIAQLLRAAQAEFSATESSGALLSKLLFVVSDTDQFYQEGSALVERWVREIQDAGIFLVLVIIDSPQKTHSILEQKTVKFIDGVPVIDEYMDRMHDKHYLVLRDIDSLPEKLGDALRQWFEAVSNE